MFAVMPRLANSRFNPKPGIMDFWNEFRKPNPHRWPILMVSCIPLLVIFYWLSNETVYSEPEKPDVTYIESFAPDRTDEEIIASNIANQEVIDLREAEAERRAQRKRDLYKALGAAAGMDVDEIERRADAERAEEEAARLAELDKMFGRDRDGGDESRNQAEDGAAQDPDEGSTP